MLNTDLSLEDAAKAVAGNPNRMQNFIWYERHAVDNVDDWAILYTRCRDSSLTTQSNSATIDKMLEPFSKGRDPDVILVQSSDSLFGHRDGIRIRVYRDGEITAAFEALYEINRKLEDYALLDEADYSSREHDADLEGIRISAWRVKNEYDDLPDDWPEDVWSWLNVCEPNELANVDDKGAYPSEEAIRRALDGLDYKRIEEYQPA